MKKNNAFLVQKSGKKKSYACGYYSKTFLAFTFLALTFAKINGTI